ncbi:phage terminase small subunit P27 family [Paracoccus sp. (in: a-proteobacteria)]|uniref:phage terminase small subunit P27 family n=1 Tax=Paracoccus sp. TaxID=267 RepID=UPI002AFF753C|nr:phage terminase small subunit P27 family [Paracoccus sp. (in: a-proteobacteria)]
MKGRKPEIQPNEGVTISVIPCPKWLDKYARAEWSRVFPLLTERRILTDADLGGLENYCIAIGRVRQMEAKIQTEEDPELLLKFIRVQDKAMATARQIGAELGVTPVSRSRPAVREKEEDDDGDNPLNV